MLDWLSGKKTYLVAAAMVVVAGLHQMQFIDDTMYSTLMGLLGGGGFAALRAAQSKPS